jgi:hypothetical protein
LLLQLFRMRCGRGGRGRGRHCLRRGNRRGIGSCRKSGTCWLDLRGRRRGSRISGRRIRESKGQPACTDYRQQACYASHRVLAEVVACFKFSRRGMTRRLRDYISERDWTGPGDTTGLEADPYTLADDPPIARIAPCPVGEHRRHRSGGSASLKPASASRGSRGLAVSSAAWLFLTDLGRSIPPCEQEIRGPGAASARLMRLPGLPSIVAQ